MPGKCHTKNSSWQTTSRGRPLPSEKPMAYKNSNVVRAASKMTDLRRLYSNKLKHKGKQESFGKQVQASINCKQVKTRKNLSQSAGTKLLVNSGCSALRLFLLFVLCGHNFLLNDKLGWQAINIIEVRLTSQNVQVMHKSVLVG